MWWTYSFKVNKALAAMRVPPSAINDSFRSNMQWAGKSDGPTPEETALVIVPKALGINFPDDVENAIAVWKYEGKIDFKKRHDAGALYDMGFAIDPDGTITGN